MSKLTRYVLRQVFLGLVIVAAGLACVLWLTQSLRFIELIISKGLSVGTFLAMTALLMPNFLTIVVPIALFAATLFAYNKLSVDREIVVMKAAGMSHFHLARPALALAFLCTGLGYFLTLWVVPESVRNFRELEWTVRNDVAGILLQEGAFNSMGSGLTIFVRQRGGMGELYGILVHDKRRPNKPMTLMAERGELVRTSTGARVLMFNGSRQEVQEDTGQLSMLYFDSYTMELSNDSEGEGRFRDARERPLADLLAPPEGLNPVDRRRFLVEAHQRLAMPLASLAFVAVALAFLLPGSFNRNGQNGRILVAIGIMVLMQSASVGLVNLSAQRLSLVGLLYANFAVPALIALWVVWRAQHQGGRRLGT